MKNKIRVHRPKRWIAILLTIVVICSLTPFGHQFFLDQQFVNALHARDYTNAERNLERGANPNALLLSSSVEMDIYRQIYGLVVKNKEYKQYRVNAITEAASFGQIPLLEKLLAKGVNVNLVSPTGENPLYAAIHNKRHETVEWLLNHGATVDFQYKTTTLSKIMNASMLLRAILNNDKKMIEILIRHHANVNEISAQNSNMLEHYLNWSQFLGEPYDIKIVKLLYNHGFRDLYNEEGFQCIDSAFLNGDLKMAKLLYSLGSDIDYKCSKDKLSFREKIFQDAEPTRDVLEMRNYILTHKQKRNSLESK